MPASTKNIYLVFIDNVTASYLDTIKGNVILIPQEKCSYIPCEKVISDFSFVRLVLSAKFRLNPTKKHFELLLPSHSVKFVCATQHLDLDGLKQIPGFRKTPKDTDNA